MYKKLKQQIQTNRFNEESKDAVVDIINAKEERLLNILQEIADVSDDLNDYFERDIIEIAEKHKVGVSSVQAQIEKGFQVELRQLEDSERARRTAMNNVYRDLMFYEKIENKMETEKEKINEWYNRYNNILKEEEMPKNPEYGLPKKEKYPLYDKAHVLAAIKFFNWVDQEDESLLAKAIILKMKEHGLRKSNVGEENRLKPYVEKSNLGE